MSKFDRDDIERLKGVLSDIEDLKKELPSGYTTSPEDLSKLEGEIKEAEKAINDNLKNIVPGQLYHSVASDGISYYEDRYFKIVDVSKKGIITYDAIYVNKGEYSNSIAYTQKEYSSSSFFVNAKECTEKMDYYNKLVEYILTIPDK